MNVQSERYQKSDEPPGANFLAATKAHPDAVVILDRLGRVRYVSAASRRLVGYKPAEIVGTHISRWVHADDLPQLYSVLSQWENDGLREPLVGRVSHVDGRWRWLEAKPLHVNGPQLPDQFIFLVREITGRRRLELLNRMAESLAGFGVWRVELGDSVPLPELSAGLMELFGYKPGERVEKGKRYWPLSMVHRADVRPVLEMFRRAIRTPQLFSFCCRIRTRDGCTRFIKTRAHVETDVEGRAVAITGVSQDITLINTVYKELKSSEEKYRLLTDRASDIICQLAPDGRIEFISPAVWRIFGKSPNQLTGEDFRSLLIEEDHGRFGHFLTQVASGEEEPVCTVRARNNRGIAWLELSGRRLKDGNGDHSAVVCAARDITERKQIELELVNARLQAEEANASKSRFLTSVSHDLRTPLNAVLGFAELIREQIFGPVGDSRYVEYASLIHESGTLLRTFLSNLLDLSKIEAGKYELHPERLKLKDVAPSCMRQILPLAAKKHLKIDDKVSDIDLELFADRQGVAHILINLLSNAAKFTPEKGRIELSARQEDGMTALTIRDTGVGIKPEDIERITAPFERALEGYGFAQEGAGLGLAIVKSLAELHGGSLEIDSEPGRGTSVTVRLPRERMKVAA